jgi:hypothetical protein
LGGSGSRDDVGKDADGQAKVAREDVKVGLVKGERSGDPGEREGAARDWIKATDAERVARFDDDLGRRRRRDGMKDAEGALA